MAAGSHFLQYLDGLVHDCGNSIANAMELPQSCAKSLMYLGKKVLANERGL